MGGCPLNPFPTKASLSRAGYPCLIWIWALEPCSHEPAQGTAQPRGLCGAEHMAVMAWDMLPPAPAEPGKPTDGSPTKGTFATGAGAGGQEAGDCCGSRDPLVLLAQRAGRGLGLGLWLASLPTLNHPPDQGILLLRPHGPGRCSRGWVGRARGATAAYSTHQPWARPGWRA